MRRMLCVAIGAWAVWFSAAADADAGVIVATDLQMMGVQSVGGMSASQSPAVPQPVSPLVRDRQQESLLNGTTTNTGGAGSPTPTFGPSTGLVALVSEGPATAQTSLVSRLALASRISLPSPLEDRFFRPPRLCD